MSSEGETIISILGFYYFIGLILTIVFRTLYLKHNSYNKNPIINFMGSEPGFTLVAWAPWLFISVIYYLIEYLPEILAKNE